MMAIVYTDALLAVPFAHLRMSHQSMRYAIAARVVRRDQHRPECAS